MYSALQTELRSRIDWSWVLVRAIWVTAFLDNGGYMKCKSRSSLDYIEEIVIREAEVPGCTPFYERQEKTWLKWDSNPRALGYMNSALQTERTESDRLNHQNLSTYTGGWPTAPKRIQWWPFFCSRYLETNGLDCLLKDCESLQYRRKNRPSYNRASRCRLSQCEFLNSYPWP